MLRWIDRVEELITQFFFWIMCLFVLIQIVSRYIMNNPLSFPDEIARHAYVWMTFIGVSLATKHDDHVRVDLIHRIAGGKAATFLEAFVRFGMFGLLAVLSILGWQYAWFSRVNRWASLPFLSMMLVTISFPLGCTLAALRALRIAMRLSVPSRNGA